MQQLRVENGGNVLSRPDWEYSWVKNLSYQYITNMHIFRREDLFPLQTFKI